jgi:hypothetical protein
MSPFTKALPLLLLLSGLLLGQGTAVDCTPGTSSTTFTAATVGTAISNSNTATPCRSWGVTYNSSGFSAFSIQFETSPDNITYTAVPNTVCSSTIQPPCVIDGANPSTTIGNQTFSIRAYGRYVRLNVTSVTGSGTITARVFGYKGLSANAGSGSGGSGGGMFSCQPGLGDGLNAITAGTYLQSECFNLFGVTYTIISATCYTDNNGTSTLNITNGAGTALLTGAITCTNTIPGASGTQSGTTTIASNDGVKFTFVADGASKQTTWTVTATR